MKTYMVPCAILIRAESADAAHDAITRLATSEVVIYQDESSTVEINPDKDRRFPTLPESFRVQ